MSMTLSHAPFPEKQSHQPQIMPSSTPLPFSPTVKPPSRTINPAPAVAPTQWSIVPAISTRPSTTAQPSTAPNVTNQPSRSLALTTPNKPLTAPAATRQPSTSQAPTIAGHPPTAPAVTLRPSQMVPKAPSSAQNGEPTKATQQPSISLAPATANQPSTAPAAARQPSTSQAPTKAGQPPSTSAVTFRPSQMVLKAPSSAQNGEPTKVTHPPSMSLAPTTANQPSTAKAATRQPSTWQAPTNSGQPSTAPTVTFRPSHVIPKAPSSAPNNKPTPTSIQNVVFTCGPEGFAVLAHPPVNVVSSIPIIIGYSIESSFPLAEYIDDLERQILSTAVAGALQCNIGGPLFGNPGSSRAGITSISGSSPKVPMNTTEIGEMCNSTVSPCLVLETQFQFAVNETVDPKVAAFLAYLLLREEMDSGSFAIAIPSIKRCQYDSPLPLLPPVTSDDSVIPNFTPIQGAPQQVSVSPWTVGTVSAMCKSQ